MDDHIKDEDRDAMAGLTSTPLHSTVKYTNSANRFVSTIKPTTPFVNTASMNFPTPPTMTTYTTLPMMTSSPEDHPPPPIDEDYITRTIYIDDDVADQLDQRQLQPLLEFVDNGGGVGIFTVPTRSTVHLGRSPCLKLRPHPLRETQVGKFLRNIVCTETQLWAGQESGVRYYNFDSAYDMGCGHKLAWYKPMYTDINEFSDSN